METKHGLVHFYRIIGTAHVIAVVYEPGELASTHSTITTCGSYAPHGRSGKRVETQWYGRLGTRVLPLEIDAIPSGDVRLKAVYAFRDAQNARCQELIRQVAQDSEIAEHCARTPMDLSIAGEVSWFDPEFADALSSMEEPATYFPVTWTE